MCLVISCQSLIIICAIHVDMVYRNGTESFTYSFIYILTSGVSQQTVGEVGMHTTTIPISFYWLGMQFNIISMALGEPVEQVTGYPQFIPSLFGSFGKILEFPLSGSHFLVNPFNIEACIQADI